MIATGVLNSNRIMPDYVMTRANIRNFTRTAAEYPDVIGTLNTVWDDGGSALFNRDWMGVAYAAENSWNINTDCERTFDSRFDRVVYGSEMTGISEVITRLSDLTRLASTQEMNEKVFWQQVVPSLGESLQLNTSDWQTVAAICDSAQALLQAVKAWRNDKEVGVWQLTIQQYKHMILERKLMLTAADAYRSACLLQSVSRNEARSRVTEAIDAVLSVKNSLHDLQNEYQKCWFLENRNHGLNFILEKYNDRLKNFDDVVIRLRKALILFDEGHYLLPPNQVRLAIEPASGQYFQSWLLVGPFQNPGGDAYDVDHLLAIGGESRAVGKVAGEFKGKDNKTYRWKKLTSQKYSKVDLASLFEQNRHVLIYAYARIKSPVPQTVRATFGSNDGIEIFCNGRRIFRKHQKRNLMPDEDSCMLPLKAGDNHILLKVDQGSGGWGFSFRLPDNTIRSHDYKYRIVD
jgi:hypothetical protein